MATPIVRSSIPSLPPPSPKSPPEYPDLYGKRRESARVQMLEREISFLEEELKSVEGLQPASRCCKEMADFVIANSDPLLPSRIAGHVAFGSGYGTISLSDHFMGSIPTDYSVLIQLEIHVLVCLVLTSLGSVAAAAAAKGISNSASDNERLK
ncbi:hypothetical protein TanjilG_03485 [Lupinus angustifolius]|uniref:G protein gamma domain-containing protein n=1 Tax=Lupinus angustifolius TaxID=3871 RepID=A0A1J7J2D6_LUPAN|nr:hypothetical protein TanjilG_03485 [Lupinus angustifolius]